MCCPDNAGESCPVWLCVACRVLKLQWTVARTAPWACQCVPLGVVVRAPNMLQCVCACLCRASKLLRTMVAATMLVVVCAALSVFASRKHARGPSADSAKGRGQPGRPSEACLSPSHVATLCPRSINQWHKLLLSASTKAVKPFSRISCKY